MTISLDLTILSEVRKAGDRSKYIRKFSSFSPLFSDNPQNFYLNLSLICNVGHFCITFRYEFRRKYTLIWPCLVVLFYHIFDNCSEYKILEPEIGLHRAFAKGSSPFHYNRPTSLPIIRIAAVTTNKIVVSTIFGCTFLWRLTWSTLSRQWSIEFLHCEVLKPINLKNLSKICFLMTHFIYTYAWKLWTKSWTKRQ